MLGKNNETVDFNYLARVAGDNYFDYSDYSFKISISSTTFPSHGTGSMPSKRHSVG